MSRSAGLAAEERAARFLRERGLRERARNFRCRQGEIDLIMEDQGVTVFVEVRARSRSDFGSAAASITTAKQRRLVHAARHWIARHGETACRFDVIALEGAPETPPQWIPDAFTLDSGTIPSGWR